MSPTGLGGHWQSQPRSSPACAEAVGVAEAAATSAPATEQQLEDVGTARGSGRRAGGRTEPRRCFALQPAPQTRAAPSPSGCPGLVAGRRVPAGAEHGAGEGDLQRL